MTILPTLALRSFVGFDNLFNELESISNQKQSSFPAHDIVRISDDEYEITLAVSGFNKKDIDVSVENGLLTIESKVKSVVNDSVGADANKEDEVIHKGISKRYFKRSFTIADDVEIKGAELKDGLLKVSMEKIIPDAKKLKTITIK